MKGIKLVVIGGGSSYTPELVEGVLLRGKTFPVKELVLVDIEAGRSKVDAVFGLVGRMIARAGSDISLQRTFDRKRALEGADFVVSQFRVGGLEARAGDESLPLKYGMIGQETTGPGGFTKALRTIPVLLDICRDMEELCPDAWLINFTNPSGIITETVLNRTKTKCIGLCNVPINMERAVKSLPGLENADVFCRFAGLNHLSFIDSVRVNGQEVLSGLMGGMSSGFNAKNIPGVDFPARFVSTLGMIPSPYLKYYYLEGKMLEEEAGKFRETGRTRATEVMEVEGELFKKYEDPALDRKPEELEKRGGALYSEAAVNLMDSIWNDRGDNQVVNVLNGRCMPDLPEDAVIETNCTIGRSGAVPIEHGPLSDTICGLVQHAKAYERLTIEAACEGSRRKAFLALTANPLVHDVEKAELLLNELLERNREYLERFSGEEVEG
jgi:6-phospho-beta-glucosidase